MSLLEDTLARMAAESARMGLARSVDIGASAPALIALWQRAAGAAKDSVAAGFAALAPPALPDNAALRLLADAAGVAFGPECPRDFQRALIHASAEILAAAPPASRPFGALFAT